MSTLPLPTRSRPGRSRRVLGIDPGTACGWAVVSVDAQGVAVVENSGAWELAVRGKAHPGARYQRLLDLVQDLVTTVDVVAYELVHRHLGTESAHVYGGIVAVLLLACADAGKPVEAVGVGKVKQRATGNGAAKKHELQEAARALLGGRVPGPDEADAIFVALAAADAVATV